MRLADWIREHGKTDGWVAGRVGRERSFITKIKNGKARPSQEVIANIQRLTEGAVTAVDYGPVETDLAGARGEAA